MLITGAVADFTDVSARESLSRAMFHNLCLFCSIISLPELKLNIDASSIKALRAGRVLRPLKLVSGIPSRSPSVNHIPLKSLLTFVSH